MRVRHVVQPETEGDAVLGKENEHREVPRVLVLQPHKEDKKAADCCDAEAERLALLDAGTGEDKPAGLVAKNVA